MKTFLFISPFCVFSLIVGSFENIVGSFEKIAIKAFTTIRLLTASIWSLEKSVVSSR